MPEAAPTTADATIHPARPHTLGEFLRIALAALTATVAVVYLAADDGHLLNTLARIVAIVALILLGLWAAQAGVERRIAQLEARQRREDYWRVYADVLTDLGGLDGEASTDSSRPPRRP